MDRRRFLKATLAVPAVAMPAVLTGRSVFAQDAAAQYPSKPIRYIVPYAAGGPADLQARSEADFLSKRFGQSIYIDNIAGGLGLPAARALVAAEPDGHAMLFGGFSHMLLAAKLSSGQNFDVWKNVAPVALTWSQPNLLIVAKKSFKSLPELLDRAKSSSKPLTFSTSGTNTTQHMSGELLARAAGIKLTHVPYAGAAQYYPDLLEGRIDMAFGTPATVTQNSETMMALIAFAPNRFAGLPDTPTATELGYKDVNVPSWGSIVVRSGVPEPIISKLDAACRDMGADKAHRDRKLAIGCVAEYVGRAEFPARIKQESETLDRFVQISGLKPA